MDTATITRTVPTRADRDEPFRRIASVSGWPPADPTPRREHGGCEHVMVVPWQLCGCDDPTT